MQIQALSPACIAALLASGAAVACALILGFLLKTGLAWRLATDIPNARSLHTRPTPRVGGWGLVPAVVVAMLLFTPSLRVVAACALALAALSQIDDRRGLSARVRFGAHVAAVAVVVAGYPAAVPWWVLALTGFLLVWLVNLYNFMDGADGLAGGMALFGFGAYAIAALGAGRPMPELAWASAALAGAAAGFLIFNFHPAKVFLGDAGSISIGFLAGAFGYWGWREHAWPFWFPAMVFAPFIGDASVTLARRLLRGEKFWQAHREHYYQRMVQLGVGHARTALLWYAVMLAGIALALWGRMRPPAVQWGAIAVWAIVLILAGARVDRQWRHFRATLNSNTEVNADAS
ncbi:Glycosyltransferase family 4 protein [Burkholderia multivorans]